eukprot:SAG31_NODE_7262_length_1739_cov_1.107927_2_plen_312_part_01
MHACARIRLDRDSSICATPATDASATVAESCAEYLAMDSELKQTADEAGTVIKHEAELRNAREALVTLGKGEINEIKAYSRLPLLLQRTMECVHMIAGMHNNWKSAKRMLSDASLLHKLDSVQADGITKDVFDKIDQMIDENLCVDNVAKVSEAGAVFLQWVLALKLCAHDRLKTHILPDGAGRSTSLFSSAQPKAAPSVGETTFWYDCPPEWESRVSNLSLRFPGVSRKHIIMAMTECHGHEGRTTGLLQDNQVGKLGQQGQSKELTLEEAEVNFQMARECLLENVSNKAMVISVRSMKSSPDLLQRIMRC